MTRRKEPILFAVIVIFSALFALIAVFDIVMCAIGHSGSCLIFPLFSMALVIGFVAYARNYFIKSGSDPASGDDR